MEPSIADTSCTNRSVAWYAASYPAAFARRFQTAQPRVFARERLVLLAQPPAVGAHLGDLLEVPLERAVGPAGAEHAQPEERQAAHTKTTKFFETVTAFAGGEFLLAEVRGVRPTCLRSRRSEPVVNRRVVNPSGRAALETEPSSCVSPYRRDAESSSRDASDRRSPRSVPPSHEFLAESSRRLCQDTEPGLRSASAREDARFADLLDAQLAMIASMRTRRALCGSARKTRTSLSEDRCFFFPRLNPRKLKPVIGGSR